MADIKKLEVSRTGVRSWVTREANQLDELLRRKTMSVTILKLKIVEFDKRLNSLDEMQTKIESELTDIDEQTADIEAASDFRNKMLDVKLAALERLADLETTPRPVPLHVSKPQARLPKLEIQKFSGDITNWEAFWDQFESIVHNNDIPVVNKFTYLRSLLEGDALETIKGLSLTEANYEIARQCLKDRYAKPERTIFLHIQSLLQLSVPSSTQNIAALWKLRDEINVHVRCLNSLGVSNDQYGVILTPLILSRLPHDIRLEWARQGKDREKDLDFLLYFLTTEIESRERSEGFRHTCISNQRSKPAGTVDEKKPVDQRTAAASALAVSSGPQNVCNFCGRPHPSHRCYEVLGLSVFDRKERFRDAGACFRCISKSHRAVRCGARCKRCSGSHHELLCRFDPKYSDNRKKPEFRAKSANTSGSDTAASKGDVKPEKTSVMSVVSKGDVKNEQSVVVSSKPDESGSLIAIAGQTVHTVLQTARVTVRGEKGTSEATILFDTGSDNSFISSALVQKIGPQWSTSRNLQYATFGGEKSTTSAHNVYKFDALNRKGGAETLKAIEVQTICAPMHQARVPAEIIQSFGDLDIVKSPHGKITIDLLVGLDLYWDLVRDGFRRVEHEGLVLQNTVFGWMLSGSWCGEPDDSKSDSQTLAVNQLICLSDMPEATIQNFWNLEAIGAASGLESLQGNSVLNRFNDSVKFLGDRYEAQLPWKENASTLNLLNNRILAEQRLRNLTRKLAKNPELEARYRQVFIDMESEGIIREAVQADCSDTELSTVFYMPHRPVVKESSVSTKVRPVFDASAKGANGISLNDCLEAGPSLIPSLVDILIRFRRWRIGITADITKAFLQIKVCRKDQDALRFLWNDKGTVRSFAFQRVPFGCTSSPFLLNATIKHHLSKYPESRAVTELQDNLFVDDWLSGCDFAEEACELFQNGCQVMREGGFPLAKSNSNSEEVTEMFYREYGSKHAETDSVKILGLKWIKSEDCFAFEGVHVASGLVTTKRVVLSFMARMFDPLGFLNPYIMYVKILLQEIWKLNLAWDEEVPPDIHFKFLKWVDGLESLRSWRIPRCYTSLPWSSLRPEQIELFCFGDASEKGFGAVVYLRVEKEDGTYDVRLVASRSRVAPLKTVSLPRLELLGALLAARLLDVVRTALKLPHIAYSCWTDSMVALGWIQGIPSKWKTFVANRVAEIQQLTEKSHWSHCPGKGNPADFLSRGVLAEDLVLSKEWLNGPNWMYESVQPVSSEGVDLEQVEQFLFNEQVSIMVVTESWMPSDQVLEVERWGRFIKAVRVTAWVLRFIHNVKNTEQRHRGDLSQEELMAGKTKLLQHVQSVSFSQELNACKSGKVVPKTSPLAKLDPFMGQDDLLRVKGRLQCSSLSYGEKHPVILPKGHFAKLLIRDKHKFLKHAGVETVMTSLRDEYWILGLRNLTKAVKRECVPCQRVDARACNEFAAPLPELRIHRAPPFSVTGLDYAGPLFCVDYPGQKFYILLFCCALVRALHLELTDSLTETDCVLALRRFSARRGLPTILYSDNAKTFQATEKELLKLFGSHSPKWKYIAPRSPWWGGWWERLVRSVKCALRKSLGGSCLRKCELETSLCEVEACLNSRPITFLGDDVEGLSPLTPSYFLIGKNAGFQTKISEAERVVSQEDLSDRELIRQRRLEIFWELWSKDYLRNLPPAIQKFRKVGEVKLGSLVLIREENVPRMQWPLGLVVKVFPSKDGAVRSVEIKTAKGKFVRPIQRLHNLEINSQDKCESSSISSDGEKTSGSTRVTCKSSEVVTRCGRQIKPRQRLDL